MGPYLEKKTPLQKRTSGVAQGIGPEFKPQYCKKKKRKKKTQKKKQIIHNNLQYVKIKYFFYRYNFVITGSPNVILCISFS
jgi:hypothetical protein